MIRKAYILAISFMLLLPWIGPIITYAKNDEIMSIAHRGASSYAPENTLAAFDKALKMGYDYIELDIRMTKDHKLVVIHDEKIDRTTTGNGSVHEYTFEEIQQFDAGSWFSTEYQGEKIPLLEEVLERYSGKIGLLIEMKSPDQYPSMTIQLSLLMQEYLDKNISSSALMIQSFQLPALMEIKESIPSLKVGLLLSHSISIASLEVLQNHISFLSINHKHLSPNLISSADSLNLLIFGWTINKATEWEIAQQLKINGIITDVKKPQPLPAFYLLYVNDAIQSSIVTVEESEVV